ncbi:MAG: glycosyltransferase family 4 protein [Candidatus Aenigmarchaeota archaeon]|nr:glycosyltransferase family 4 protein [Candidatus Aenigmarchaeota archaeon]
MKIVMIADLILGGEGRHALGLSEELKRQGHDVEIISFEKGQDSLPYFNLFLSYKVLLSKKALFRLLEEKNPDIIHMHLPFSTMDFLVEEIKRKTKKPVVCTIHLSPGGRSIIDSVVTLYLKKLSPSLKHSDKIICVSKFVKTHLKRISGISEKKLLVIPNGVDVHKFRPQANKSRDFRMLFVGRLSPEKGLSLLFKSFGRLGEGKLCVIGDGPLKSKCIREAVKNKRVEFLGRVNDEALIDNYSSASVVVVPSTWQEAFGMVSIEAMACGTPPLAFAVGGIPEVIDDGCDGFLVKKQTPEALSRRINEARASDLVRIGKNGRKKVLRMYDWKIIAKETLKVYQSLA